MPNISLNDEDFARMRCQSFVDGRIEQSSLSGHPRE
jgi:hypothetical protein